MARLNSRRSYQPSSPFATDSEDKENEDSVAPRMQKGKARKTASVQRPPFPTSALPTPESPTPAPEASSSVSQQKRKRTLPTQDDDDDDESDEDTKRFNRYLDPNQDPCKRREIKKRTRALERDFQANRDDLLQNASGEGLRKTIHSANNIFRYVKQTNDATADSRLLVNVSDLASKKTAQLVLGDSSTGIDVDEFLSKCITYMRNGGPLDRENEANVPSTAGRRHTRNADDEDDEDGEDLGEALDWEVLGRHACYPFNLRPAIPSFLLGPLSVEKKQRTQIQRRPRNAKDTNTRETRPEELSKESMQQAGDSGITEICMRIRQRLTRYLGAAYEELDSAGFTEDEHRNDPACKAIMKKYRLRDTGGLLLFEVILNQQSFGQTVENLLYVSFLVKEGSVGIALDSMGLPCIDLAEHLPLEARQRNGSQKLHFIWELDFEIYENLRKAFDTQDFTIPHREGGPYTDQGD